MSRQKYALATTVRPEEEGLMIKEIIYGRLCLSRGLIRRMKRGGGIFRNGERDFLTRRVQAGDRLELFFHDQASSLKPQPIPLEIVYEDDYLLIINKPAGMPVHPTGSYQKDTLANALAHHWREIGLEGKVRLVHRLDKDTSGLILVAKEPYSLQRLLLQLQRGELSREYLAVAAGQLRPPLGTIRAPIGRSLEHGVKRTVCAGGKAACTEYETLAVGSQASLLRLRLFSGRTHQIRVHLASLGHPLLGDPLYSKACPQLTGQALHAWRLQFVHPRTAQQIKVSSPLPPEMRCLWVKIRQGKAPRD